MNKPTEKEIDELRRFLISHHEDGDDNSYYMKFAKLRHYIEDLEHQVWTYEKMYEVLAKHRKQEENKSNE